MRCVMIIGLLASAILWRPAFEAATGFSGAVANQVGVTCRAHRLMPASASPRAAFWVGSGSCTSTRDSIIEVSDPRESVCDEPWGSNQHSGQSSHPSDLGRSKPTEQESCP